MSSRVRRVRPLVVVATAVALVAAGQVAASSAATAAPTPSVPPTSLPAGGSNLDKQDLARVAAAERAGKPTVTVLVAAEPGRADTAAAQLRSIGATVTATNERVDYVKAVVPVGKADRAAGLGAVQDIDVDGLIKLDDPRPAGTTAPLPQTPPGATTPRSNPYLPTRDTGAEQFSKTFPSYDGRNTTIAVLDSGVDLANPALATTSRGERKIVDWYDANAVNSGDGTWVRTASVVNDGTFTASGRTWVAPAGGGPFNFGLFSETSGDLGSAGSETGGDLNRDGDRSDVWGVLLDPTTKQVRVDLDDDGDFTDQTAMTDYATNFDIGYFGTDDPATAIAERVPFVVQTDKPGYVNIGIAGAEHGSHVAGIAAGNDLFGGKMDGAAPGAKVLSVKVCLTTASCTSSGLIDGVLYAATHGADLANVSIGGLPALNDGNNARAELYNRTIAEYGMQLFISAGNDGAGVNSVGDPAVATDAIAVGSSITSDTWLSNYGSRTSATQSLHPFSSRGPREDGGFKPDIVAPGAAVSTTPLWQPGGPVVGTYALPPGYSMLQGTSMAAPQAAGAAALLISGYKQTHSGRRPTPEALRSAIRSTARFLPGVGAYAQGAGLFSVPLAALALAANPKPDAVSTSVEVHTVLAGFLARPGIGVGIHDREGVVTGQAYTRDYTLTRTSGAASAVNYLIGWVGNDGTFSTARTTVSLPLNTPVTLPVRVNPRTAGLHSALLRIDNLRTVGIDVQTLNTVIAPAELTAARNFEFADSGTIARNQAISRFVRVPVGTSALTVSLVAGGDPGKGQVRFLRYDPTGVALDSTSSLNCYNPDAGAGCALGTAGSRTVSNPTPGVWEIVIEARRTSDVDTAPWSLTVGALGARVSPDPDEIASATVGQPVTRQYTVTNTAAAFTGRLVGGPLGSARIARPTITDLAQQQYPVQVTPGSTSLTATIGNTSDPSADLDLAVFNCTTGTCVLAGQSADGDSEESVQIQNPAAGTWIVLVDGYSVPSGSTQYDYVDQFTSPALGSVAVTDSDAPRASGASWTVPGTVVVGAAPAAGRVLRGSVVVRTSSGTTVGSGTVLVNSVTG